MNLTNDNEIKEWLVENLCDKNEGAKITGQSVKGFEQSVRLHYIKPFFEIEGNSRANIRLYKKSELSEYAKNKKK